MPDAFSEPDPSNVPLLKNFTEPVGIPPLPVTAALSTSAFPAGTGFALALITVAVLAWVSTCRKTGETAPALFASPEYTAVIECVPAARADVVYVALPAPLNGTVLRTLAPSLSVTVPVGAPELPVTVTIKVTGLPAIDGFALDETNACVRG